MSDESFTADWLSLREPVDHRSRDRDLEAELRAWLPDEPRILDLGCGTGSNLRHLAPALARPKQRWTLVDHDVRLLAKVEPPRGVTLETRRADLAGDLDAALAGAPDLITASALLDLTSAAWVEQLVRGAHSLGAAVLVTLTYDGRRTWTPRHADDNAVTRALNRDQKRDKGFGRALGPDAPEHLENALGRTGFRVRSATSDWRLGPEDAALHREMIRGIAEAVSGGSARVSAWAAGRREAVERGGEMVVGHRDVLGVPAS